MITIFRKNQRILMLIVAILTIIAFAWLYNPDIKSGPSGPGYVAEIYGKKMSQADVDRKVKSFSLALAMQQFDLIGALGGMAENENEALTEFVFNLIVLQKQAEEMGISPTNEQVADRIKRITVFQTDGQFDPRKYAMFVEEQLGPKGFTELQLEDVVRDTLRLETIRAVIGAPVAVGESELKDAAKVLQKAKFEVVRFARKDFLDQAVVKDEEVQGFYNVRKPTLLSNETRVVEYVEFAPKKDLAGLTGKARVEAQQEQANEAIAFVEKMTSSSFGEAAKAEGLTVAKTPAFDRNGGITDGGVSVDKTLAEGLQQIVPTAFLLTESTPESDVVQAGDRFYVLKLDQVNPRRGLMLEEVRPQLVEFLKLQKADRLARESANVALAKVREEVAGGRLFAEAARAAGLKVETFTDVDLTSSGLLPIEQGAGRLSLLMKPGQLSGFVPDADGGFAVYLVSRAPLDAAVAAKEKEEMSTGLLENKRNLLFLTWLSSARQAAELKFAGRQQ